MRVGIPGSGLMGGKLGQIFTRSRERLTTLAQEAGGNVLKQAGELRGKVIVTCSLPMNESNTGLVIAHSSSRAEELAKRAPKAGVVCAFNTVPSEVLFGVFEARAFALLIGQLAYEGEGGPELAYRIERFGS